MTIGILGGYGETGRHTVAHLLANTTHSILIGGRSEEAARSLSSGSGERVRMQKTDIFDPLSLDAFCESCDLVINCAGPSALIFDRVARAALGRGIHYIDPTANTELYKTYENRDKEIRDKGVTFIFYAGLNPGISGVYPLHLADTWFDTVSSLDFFQVGRGPISFNSAYDLVASMNDGSTEGMVYWEEGIIKKGISPLQNHLLPAPVGRADVYPVLSHEHQRVAEDKDIPVVRAYSAYNGKHTATAMFSIQVLKQNKTGGQLKASTRKFMEAADKDMEELDPCFVMHLVMTGTLKAQPKKVISTLRVEDGYRTMGQVLAFSAEQILNKSSRGPGCFILHEAIASEALMGMLEAHSLIPETYVIDEIIESESSGGII